MPCPRRQARYCRLGDVHQRRRRQRRRL